MMSPSMPHNCVMNQFPNDNFSLNTIQLILLIIGLVDFFLLHLLTDSKRISNFFFQFQPSIQSQLISSSHSKDCGGIKEGDVDIVLRSLGMLWNHDEATVPANFDAYYLFNLFEEENPSLDELKEAFDVFDDNRDGFIDAKELQKVLYSLGLKEGSDAEKCTRMICVFDENGDGRMDFDEFVKFIETNLG